MKVMTDLHVTCQVIWQSREVQAPDGLAVLFGALDVTSRRHDAVHQQQLSSAVYPQLGWESSAETALTDKVCQNTIGDAYRRYPQSQKTTHEAVSRDLVCDRVLTSATRSGCPE